VSAELEEKAVEEAVQSAVKKEMMRELEGLTDIGCELKPACDKRQSVAPDSTGYAMLGEFVDQDLVFDEENRAALLNSSLECEDSVDLSSEGSDAEVDDRMERMLKVKYRQQIGADARELVQLGATVSSNKDGELSAVEWMSVDMAEKAGYIKETFYLEEDTLLMLQSWLQ
jgi:hypothetical protein